MRCPRQTSSKRESPWKSARQEAQAAPMGAETRNGSMFAVIRAGGKQFRVAANDVIRIEKIAGEPGDIIELSPVLMLSDDKGVEIGNPVLNGATVAAEVLGQERGETVVIFKKRRRHHYRRRNGHRQSFTALKITEILTDGRKPASRGKASKTKAHKGQAEEKAAKE
jgi:large subunit ribosomal protein L21